ncbi:MAG: hypothetical protein DMG14_25725 [Acidobacteria bacterium]|nr:MAG: hypothetical protein DMG14_25725 [Acidobacteriota bacterium]
MKRIGLIGMAGFAVIAIAGVIVLRTMAAKEAATSVEVSPKAAKSLQQKIDAIKDSEDNPKHKRGASRVELFETELESYLLYSLKEDIPAQIDSADVQLGQDTVGLDTQITFTSNATGNPVVDALVGGTHNLFVKGKLVAQERRGKFDLQDVRVDGIPVPNILIQSLIKRYVKPKYPDVDLNEPFDMPWGIESLKLEQGKATVIY